MITSESASEAQTIAPAPVRRRSRPARFGVRHGIALRIVDFLSFVIAGTFVLVLAHRESSQGLAWGTAAEILAIVAAVGIVVFELLGMYRRSFATSARDEVYATFSAFVLLAVPVVAIVLFLPQRSERVTVGLALLVGATTLSVGRFIAHVVRVRVFPPKVRRIVIAGTPGRVAGLPGELALTPDDRVQRFSIDAFDHDVARATQEGGIERLEWLRDRKSVV